MEDLSNSTTGKSQRELDVYGHEPTPRVQAIEDALDRLPKNINSKEEAMNAVALLDNSRRLSDVAVALIESINTMRLKTIQLMETDNNSNDSTTSLKRDYVISGLSLDVLNHETGERERINPYVLAKESREVASKAMRTTAERVLAALLNRPESEAAEYIVNIASDVLEPALKKIRDEQEMVDDIIELGIKKAKELGIDVSGLSTKDDSIWSAIYKKFADKEDSNTDQLIIGLVSAGQTKQVLNGALGIIEDKKNEVMRQLASADMLFRLREGE